MSSMFQQNLDEHRALFARLEVLSEPVARAAEPDGRMRCPPAAS